MSRGFMKNAWFTDILIKVGVSGRETTPRLNEVD